MEHSFDPAFQRHIIASFIEEQMAEGLDCLKEEFYEDEVTGDIAGCVRDFYLREKEPPGKEAIIYEIKQRGIAPGRKIIEYIETIEEIYDCIGDNGKFYREKAKEFIRTRNLLQKLKDSYRLAEEGSIEDAMSELQKAISSNGYHKEAIYDYLQEIDSRARHYCKAREGVDKDGRISTGFIPIDDRLQGGLGKGETGVIVAPPKHGKTTALISIATYALLQRKKVLYISLELSQRVISSKFDSNIFCGNLDLIKKKPVSFKKKLEEVREMIRGANLSIAEFPTKSLSIYKMQGLVERLSPDIVFVDYAALLKSSRNKDERRFELTDIHEGLRGLAGHCQVPIWTAHQANRPSLTRREIGMENVAEDFNIVAVCDVGLSINQSEEEKGRGVLRLHIMANRLGASGDSIECKVNWSHSKISPIIDDGDLE